MRGKEIERGNSSQTKLVKCLKIDAEIWNVFPTCVCGTASPQIRRLLPQIGRHSYSENRKVSIEDDVEGFFQRALSLYVPKHPENRQLAYGSSGSFIRPSIVEFRYSAAVFIM